MRKITKQAAAAFIKNENFKKSNTEVQAYGAITRLFLHGNLIAEKNNKTGVTEITNAGWATNTTKERLNALPGVSIHQKNWLWYLNGRKWNGRWTKIN